MHLMQTMIRGYELILFVHIQYFNAYYSHPQPTTLGKEKKTHILPTLTTQSKVQIPLET